MATGWFRTGIGPPERSAPRVVGARAGLTCWNGPPPGARERAGTAPFQGPALSLRRVGRKGVLLEVAAARLLALDGLEQRLEVALAEAQRAVPLDELEEHRRA